jgi:hypothetical protein
MGNGMDSLIDGGDKAKIYGLDWTLERECRTAEDGNRFAILIF